MNRESFRLLLNVLCICLVFFSAVPHGYALDRPFDHSAWDKFLKKFVNEKGEVDYQAAKSDPVLLEEYLNQIGRIDFRDFRDRWPREEKLAVLLNAYHAGLVRAIAHAYPVSSVQSIVGVWENQDIRIAEVGYSLNNILADRLIRAFRNEKIHAALFTGAKDSPRLHQEAFTGAKVEGQLFLAAKEFVNDPKANQIVPGEKKIRISSIFKWHAIDFLLNFGRNEPDQKFSEQEMAVISFLAHYLEDQNKVSYLEEKNYKIQYLPFDWSLNDWHSEKKATPPAS